MLVGQYLDNPAAVMTFADPACDHTQPMHIASCTVTLYAEQDGAVLYTDTVRLPVAEHLDDAAILAMFQSQHNSLPQFEDMVPV
jgi:hypothetical protein